MESRHECCGHILFWQMELAVVTVLWYTICNLTVISNTRKGTYMKKHILLLVTSLLLLTGCADKASVDKPYEIAKGTTILSYYDTESEIDIDGFEVVQNTAENTMDYLWHRDNDAILVNEDGVIRSITVVDKDVKTFRSISVGDSVDKIEQSFNCVFKFDGFYRVVFYDGVEVGTDDQTQEDALIMITYYTDGSQITAIRIGDKIFAETLM